MTTDQSSSAPLWVGPDALDQVLGTLGAQQALTTSLVRDGLDVEGETIRSIIDLPDDGTLFLMPSPGSRYHGVKILTAYNDNPSERGLPLIQGQFLLFDGTDGRALALVDGVALTNLRTAAVTLLAVRHALAGRVPAQIAVLGAGTQARAHAQAFTTTFPDAQICLIARDQDAATRLAAEFGPQVRASDRSALPASDVVACCTSARSPILFDADVRDDAVIAAVGAYELDAQEVDPQLVGRCQVLVESRRSAAAEAGDVMRAVTEGRTTLEAAANLAELVRGDVAIDTGRPVFFKSTGMGWQDLSVAGAAYDAARPTSPAA